VTPGTARLVVYWFQMLLCACESFPRIVFHAVGFLLAGSWLLLNMLVSASVAALSRWLSKCLSTQSQSDTLARTDQMAKAGKKNTPPVPLAEQQFHHHRWHVYVYVELTPKILLDNLRNPWRPFFADGVEVEIFRPDMPPDPHINSDCCPRESCSCKCFNHVEEITVRYFRAQFFALSGCRSLQCGACLGPCSTQCCYTPCFGGDEESGHCKACEPEGVRINRWVHEADERKRERTVQFFYEAS